jgi:hypothetical protein
MICNDEQTVLKQQDSGLSRHISRICPVFDAVNKNHLRFEPVLFTFLTPKPKNYVPIK